MAGKPGDEPDPKPIPIDETIDTMALGFEHLEVDDSDQAVGHDALTVKRTLPSGMMGLEGMESKYEIAKELGKGGFAWVYLVKNLDLNRFEAMKILIAELSEEEDVSNRFVKEAQISANFQHQNIVTIFEVQRRGFWKSIKAPDDIKRRHQEPFVYFTMSFVEGQTATSLVKKMGRLPQKQAMSIGIDACAALDYAHNKGVIHRDVKPDNILVDRRGNGIVMDFGIAKVMDQTRHTAAGTFMGTARYVSPEQAMGNEIDCRADIYSLGISLYEMVTGRVPFDSSQWMTVLYQHVNEPPPLPEQFVADINRDFRAIILRMLEKKPERRFQTAREVRDALASVYQKMGGATVQTASLDHIETRADLVQPGAPTASTEQVGGRRDARPSGQVEPRPSRPRESKPPTAAVKPWVAAVLIGLGLIAVVAIAIAMSRPNPEPLPPLARGQLLISAFPKGELIMLVDEKGNRVEVPEGELPLILPLPEGSYKMVVSYEGKTQELSAYVSPKVPLAKTHAIFELENDLFLMEDLR